MVRVLSVYHTKSAEYCNVYGRLEHIQEEQDNDKDDIELLPKEMTVLYSSVF